jgi:alginate O-acetyltransferase complex protein AlgJ
VPLQNALWEKLEIDAIAQISSAINSEKWADPDIFKPYQEVVAGYLHETDAGTEIWVKVEFMPWVKFLEGITDEDKDGFKEVFGKLNLENVSSEIQQKAFDWITKEYMAKVLDREQIVDWITNLASYWYPSLNTDLVDMTGKTEWPDKDTEKKVRRKLKKTVVKNPIAVMRGNPHGKPIYNIFVVEGLEEEQKEEVADESAGSADKKLDGRVSENFKQNDIRFKKELKPFGNYEAWTKVNAKLIQTQQNILKKLPPGQMGFKGKGDWVFFGKSLAYTTAGDLAKQSNDKNPLPHLVVLKKYFDEQNINLLFVPIPNKVEIYFKSLGMAVPKKSQSILYPYGRKFLADLQKAGIEVIDLLPHFLKAMKEDSKHKANVYQRQDTHWTNRGIQIAAQLIADRVKEYAWFGELEKVEYKVVDTTFSRIGDIVNRLPEADRTKYPAVKLDAKQVYTPEGKPYRGGRTSPVMLIGDSFTGVFEYVDCKSAGVGANIAAKTGVPVDVITSWGGGPLVRAKMMRARQKYLGSKRLVIYMMVARDMYDYSQSWEPLKVEQ